jgi:hypothetical protein
MLAPVPSEAPAGGAERTPEPPILSPTAPAPPKSDTTEIVATAFRGLGFALSARALLLIAILGAFVLATMAMVRTSNASLFVLIAYSVLVVLPVVALEIAKGRR